MKTTVVVLAGISLLAVPIVPQPKNVQVSTERLSSDQIAVYSAVLEHWLDGDMSSPVNLANVTKPLVTDSADKCARGLTFEKKDGSGDTVHLLDAAIAPQLKLVLVDPQRQEEVVKQNDPEHLMRRAFKEGRLDDKELENTVSTAVATGLFTLSEIAFDKHHRYALVSYGFVCGRLCGHGETLLLKRSGRKWRISKTCAEWTT